MTIPEKGGLSGSGAGEQDPGAAATSSERILLDFHVAVLDLHAHGPGPVSATAFKDLRFRLDDFFAGGKKFLFRLREGGAEVNGASLSPDPALRRALSFIGQGLASLGSEGFSLESGITEAEIEAFASRLLKPRGGGLLEGDGRARLAGFSHLALLAAGSAAGQAPPEKVTSPRARAALEIHHRLRSVLEEAVSRVKGERRFDLRPAFNAVTGIVDEMSGDDRPILALASCDDPGDYLASHLANMAVLSVALGNCLGLDRQALAGLGMAALFADLGMFFVPPEILSKEGPLTAEEARTVRDHTIQGARRILAGGPITGARSRCALAALCHHPEHAPADLGDRDIFTSVIAVADAYDAMVSPRRHRAPRPPAEALAEILADPRRDQGLARIFANLIGWYPPGVLVRLEGGEVCLVLSTPPATFLDRPRVKPLLDAGGTPVPAGAVHDLAERGPDGRFLRTIAGRVDPGPDFGPEDLAALW